MRRWAPRFSLYVVVALLVWGAITVIRPLPERKAGEVLVGKHVPTWVERVDSLSSGETITGVLERGGLTHREATEAVEAAGSVDPRRLRAGMRITLGGLDSATSTITLHLAIDRLLHLTRTDSGWVSREEVLPWNVDTVVVAGVISSTLSDAFESGATAFPSGARDELAWDVADVFEYRMDMSRDLREGDRFAAAVERLQGPQGLVRSGKVLAVEYVATNSRVRAIRFESPNDGRSRFYDDSGRSMAAAFLRAPLAFRRISSNFGMRRHPILGIWRQHAGTDYSAVAGTPVRSVGDGTVLMVGRRGGYGNVVEVRHPNGFVTRYGHLRGFARGLRRGARVGIGETIGYVGMTGLATAPHLHFEVLVGGVQRNPRTALASASGAPLDPQYRVAFDQLKGALFALIDSVRNSVASN